MKLEDFDRRRRSMALGGLGLVLLAVMVVSQLVGGDPAVFYQGRVESGSVVGPQPRDGVTLSFYVPATARNGLRLGRRVRVRCDGCARPLTARITFVSAKAVYPPGTGGGTRPKNAVYLVEAQPEPGGPPLHPGQKIEVYSGW